jgi:hypothetical protein
MKNIKNAGRWIFEATIGFCAGITAILLFLLVVSILAIWAAFDFDPYFFHIDSCLDGGGRWNEEIHECEPAP